MTTMMKAAVYHNYGGPEVLQIESIEKPQPGVREILIRIHATAVNSGDCRLRKADPFAVRFFFGLLKPKKSVLGDVFSGVVESTGTKVTRFKTGDQVFGSTMMQFGAYAEYICLPETGALVLKPAALTHTEAASLPFGGTTALHFIQKANIQPGQKVLIYGASGAVGSAAIQIAKYFGAEVTGVSSTRNLELLKSLGADHVLDYTKTNFTRESEKYDVVFETVNKATVGDCLAALKENGTLLLGAAMLPQMLQGARAAITSRKKVLGGVAKGSPEAIAFLQKMVEAGKLKPVIDQSFSLDQMVGAHAYVDGGHKRGNVAIQVI